MQSPGSIVAAGAFFVKKITNAILKFQRAFRKITNATLNVQTCLANFVNATLNVQTCLRKITNATLNVQDGIRDFAANFLLKGKMIELLNC